MVTVPKKPKNQVPQPVTTSQQPVIGCALCEWTRGYDPAATTASAVLTDHYNRDHTAALTSA
jgi:hypothetical protein